METKRSKEDYQLITNLIKTNARLENQNSEQKKLLIKCRRRIKFLHSISPRLVDEITEKLIKKLNKI